MNEMITFAKKYESKASELRIVLDKTTDPLDRIKLSTEIIAYQTMVADIYNRILELQIQN